FATPARSAIRSIVVPAYPRSATSSMSASRTALSTARSRGRPRRGSLPVSALTIRCTTSPCHNLFALESHPPRIDHRCRLLVERVADIFAVGRQEYQRNQRSEECHGRAKQEPGAHRIDECEPARFRQRCPGRAKLRRDREGTAERLARRLD